jgi:hypothetical protein
VDVTEIMAWNDSLGRTANQQGFAPARLPSGQMLFNYVEERSHEDVSLLSLTAVAGNDLAKPRSAMTSISRKRFVCMCFYDLGSFPAVSQNSDPWYRKRQECVESVDMKRPRVSGERPRPYRLPVQRSALLVRAWPEEAGSDLKKALTVTFSSETNFTQDMKSAYKIFEENGFVVYSNIRNVQTQLNTKYNEVRKQLDEEYDRRKRNPKGNDLLQFKSVFKGEGTWNPGDGCKKICAIAPGDPNAAASSMNSYIGESLRVIDPDQCVVQGQLYGERGDPVMQTCFLEDKKPRKGSREEPQDEHVDANVAQTPTGDKNSEGLQRCNVQQVLKGGVISWFFSVYSGYCLGVYPNIVQQSKACVQYFHDNVDKIKESYRDENLSEDEMRQRIVDHIVQHLEKEFSDLKPDSLAPVFIRCDEGDIIRLNSIVPHFGLPLHKSRKNIRGFALTSTKVIQQVIYHRLPTTYLIFFVMSRMNPTTI